MTTSTHPDAALQAIQTALQTPQASLTTIRNTLKSQYEALYPVQTATSASSTHVNPSRLLSHHKALQKTIPTTRDALLALHNEKHDLAATCLTTVAESRRAAAAFLPVALPDLDVTLDGSEATADGGEIGRELERSAARLGQLLEQVTTAHRRFIQNERTEEFDGRQLDIALLQAAMQTSSSATAATMVDEEPKQVVAPVVKKTAVVREAVADENVAPNIPKQVGTGGKGRAEKSGDGGESGGGRQFKPVEKADYNRLPRNLKIKAGKLADVNDVYERVFAALVGAKGPLSDKEMMEKAGVSDIGAIEVLRGLSVVSKGREGWKLFERAATGKGKGRASLRQRS